MTNTASKCDYPLWGALVDACDEYARSSGWRFALADFMALDAPGETPSLRESKLAAMPVALDFAERARASAAALASGAETPALIVEFQACQRLVATEAVYNSMVATVNAVGLGGEDADGVCKHDEDAAAYHDMSQPVEVIARRLLAYHASVESQPELRDARQRRLLHASFIVE